MYITNKPEIAKVAENAGVDRIFIDMEYIGKSDRQGGMDTVQNYHTFDDIRRIKNYVSNAELLVRVNPIHDATGCTCSSEEEIDRAIEEGADIIMLPFFKTSEEVEALVRFVRGRAKVFPLLETREALENVDNILSVKGIDEIHIGINDLSLCLGRRFMFELLADGTVEYLCNKIKNRGIPFGFGGIASIGKGLLPAERVIMEHYRLGSEIAILSRSFCNTQYISDLNEIERVFKDGIYSIRRYENYCVDHPELWENNRRETAQIINQISVGL